MLIGCLFLLVTSISLFAMDNLPLLEPSQLKTILKEKKKAWLIMNTDDIEDLKKKCSLLLHGFRHACEN